MPIMHHTLSARKLQSRLFSEQLISTHASGYTMSVNKHWTKFNLQFTMNIYINCIFSAMNSFYNGLNFTRPLDRGWYSNRVWFGQFSLLSWQIYISIFHLRHSILFNLHWSKLRVLCRNVSTMQLKNQFRGALWTLLTNKRYFIN